MPLDGPTVAFLQSMAEAAGPAAAPPWELEPDAVRGMIREGWSLLGTGPEMLHTEDHHLATSSQDTVRVRVLSPVAEPTAVIVYLHGGGWVLEDIEGYEALGRELAARTGAAVVLVNYRKAPEHPFPAAVEDAWSGLGWAWEERARLAHAGAPLIVAGDSAGANLAAVVALRARDRGGPEVTGQILVCPATDSDLTRASYQDVENQTLVTAQFMRWFWDHYVPDESRRDDPEAAPLRAASHADLPATLVLTAEYDVLRDEGEAYAETLVAAGNAVQHHRWAGQMHTFFSLINVLPASTDALDEVARWTRSLLADRHEPGLARGRST